MAAPEVSKAAALDWAMLGFRVFPLRPGAKTPLLPGWHEKATSRPEDINTLWSEAGLLGGEPNIGIATGHGLMVLDFDCKNGQHGLESLD